MCAAHSKRSARAKDTGYTRFPVFDGDMEHVVGMAHYRDLHDLPESARPTQDLRAILRPIRFVAASAPLESVLADLLERGTHMAIVVDEFGGTAGLLTLEDIFEELFGEIRDEFDTSEGDGAIRRVGKDHYVLDGATPLHQANARLGLGVESGEVTTLGGVLTAQLGRLPRKGERIEIGSHVGLVREVDRRRVRSLELWRGPAR